MVVHVESRARSFIAIGIHYLYDENKERTSERVAWTTCLNTPTADPEKALRWMSYTAKTAEQLRFLHGGSVRGTKPRKACYYYCLSWHPSERPDREEQMKTALKTLYLLGLSEHETLIIAHREKAHNHLHIITNIVHPRTGLACPIKYDYLALSAWAESYERGQGRILCVKRVENNAKRNAAAGAVFKQEHSQAYKKGYRLDFER